MTAKIEKINAEIERIRAKVANYQDRLRQLERQKTEIENTEIVELVRNVDATPQELAAFIRAFRKQSGTPLFFQNKQEEDTHE